MCRCHRRRLASNQLVEELESKTSILERQLVAARDAAEDGSAAGSERDELRALTDELTAELSHRASEMNELKQNLKRAEELVTSARDESDHNERAYEKLQGVSYVCLTGMLLLCPVFTDSTFADDLNCYRVYAAGTRNETVLEDLEDCQLQVHRWGAANRVGFDASKESLHVLHRTEPTGEHFKILGVLFDTKLHMGCAVHELAVKAGWKLKGSTSCQCSR